MTMNTKRARRMPSRGGHAALQRTRGHCQNLPQLPVNADVSLEACVLLTDSDIGETVEVEVQALERPTSPERPTT